MATFRADVDILRNLKSRHTTHEALDITASMTLDIADPQNIIIGSATSAVTLTLPAVNATGIGVGFQWYIINNDNANVSIVDSASVSVGTVPSGQSAILLATVSAAPGTWSLELVGGTITTISSFSFPFNATTGWGNIVGGFYTITVTETVHGKGSNSQLSVLESSTNAEVYVDEFVATNGDVSIRVPSDPDLRFAGRIIIGGA